MALIAWSDSLSVQVAEIDQQHKNLIAMINELSEAMKAGKGKEVLEKIVNSLIGYTATHFKTEEKYFARFAYPDTENHQKEHAAFVKKVTDFKNGFEAKKVSVTVDVLTFLSDWLKNHIMGTDKKYSQFFHEKGLK
jgi:hemerythrin